MVNNTKIAPFTDEEVRILKLWQENNLVAESTLEYDCSKIDQKLCNSKTRENNLSGRNLIIFSILGIIVLFVIYIIVLFIRRKR